MVSHQRPFDGRTGPWRSWGAMAPDERAFEMLNRIRKTYASEMTLGELKKLIREQVFMLLIDEQRALETIPVLLRGHKDKGPRMLELIRNIDTDKGPLSKSLEKRFAEVAKYFIPEKTGKQGDVMDVKNYSAVEKLKDGREVVIRAVRPDDKDRFIEGFGHLSKEAIYRRFFSARKQLTEEELKEATEIDFDLVVALVTEIEEKGEKHLIGVCRYVGIDKNDPPKLAEVAFTVIDEWQGKGLGKILFRHLTEIGKAMGIEKFEAVVLSENRGMMKIFTSSGLNVNKNNEGREIYFDIQLKE